MLAEGARREVRGMRQKRRVAIVVGSGGIKCAAALGLWQVLQREGIEISMAVGSSGGSIYAAIMALGYDAATAEAMTVKLWTPDLMSGYTSRLRAVQSGASRFTERSGLADGRRLFERLHEAFGEQTFADAGLPLTIVSTDLSSGEVVTHSRGRVVDAIRASIAIPQLFPPHELEDRLLVDDAVSNPLPVDVAVKEGAEIVLAMGFEVPTRKRMRSYASVTAHFNNVYQNNILRTTFAFANLAHHGELIPILPRFAHPIGTFDSDQLPYLIEAGRKETEAALPYIRRLLAAPGSPGP
jgi:NTE family protein